jgi:hypothetical protein
MSSQRIRREWREARDSFHRRILQRLRSDEHYAINQYKDLYFRIFREAYEAGYCVPLSYDLVFRGEGCSQKWIHTKPKVTGDSIWEYALREGWIDSAIGSDDVRYQQIQKVSTWWDAWGYAWRQLGYRTRRHRTVDKNKVSDR